ncbi:outer membrane-specific lipoprotein transporter subunit LolC [Escherichia coli]|uniref:Outer membrane-specific lipoprotein transporter subunit LolC n=1 Tax=Escherichia coli TaxID=562 RepID=A0A377E5Z8_ECOLX|nr:outer membrane-specific lipoprotein transporter subunit LolC [Escherichia coli]
MYQPVALFIGLRYMRGRAADRFGRFVSWLSTIGITLGVMALVTVLSVMNGFERELQNNILGLMPQAILSSEHGSLNPQQLPERQSNWTALIASHLLLPVMWYCKARAAWRSG